MKKKIRTEKVTYETIDGKPSKILRVFHDGIEKKRAVFPDLRIEEKEQEEAEKKKALEMKNKKAQINSDWKKSKTTEDKVKVLAMMVGLE